MGQATIWTPGSGQPPRMQTSPPAGLPQRRRYTTDEVGERLDRDPYTVREWARHGRIRAEKRACGRGRSKAWVVSHEELERIRNHGLLPLRPLSA